MFPLWDTPVPKVLATRLSVRVVVDAICAIAPTSDPRLWGWFTDVRRDELGDCGDFVFFFWVLGNDDVRVWGVSSSFASESESRVWVFVFV